MELYDITLNEWSILEEKLPIRLSNHACLSIEENKVMILGGGSVDGFSLDIYQFNLDTREIKVTTRMQAGRDLRNKVFAYNDEVYVVGGCKSCSGEKINLNSQQWTNLKHYSTLVNDPLDSWYLALVYQNPLLQAREQDSMFRISDKLPALESHYPNEFLPVQNDDELEDNSYLGPIPGMTYHLPPGSEFEYDDGVSLEHSNYGEEELPDLAEDHEMDLSHTAYDQ